MDHVRPGPGDRGEVGLRPAAGRQTEARARRLKLRRVSELLIEGLIHLCGFSAVLFVFGIFFFVFREGQEFLFHKLDLGQFFTSPEWYPNSHSNKRYGALALIAGTLSVTTLSMAIAVPFGLGASIFVSKAAKSDISSRPSRAFENLTISAATSPL